MSGWTAAICFPWSHLENLLGPSPSSSSKSILRNNHRRHSYTSIGRRDDSTLSSDIHCVFQSKITIHTVITVHSRQQQESLVLLLQCYTCSQLTKWPAVCLGGRQWKASHYRANKVMSHHVSLSLSSNYCDTKSEIIQE